MSPEAAVLAAAGIPGFLLAVGWYGSHLTTHPPKKSKMETFPEMFGLPFEKISFVNARGQTLRGWFIPAAAEAKGTLLILHGWGDNKGFILDRTRYLRERGGYNLIYFDFTACGESDGEECSIGYLERADFDAALEWLRRERPELLERFAVYGASMGGAVAIHGSADAPEVRAVLAENTFASVKTVGAQWAWINMGVPYFPFIAVTHAVTRWRFGGDPESSSPIYHVARLAPRPLFLIHGSGDRLMPLDQARRLFEAAGEPKALWVIDGADHGKCQETAGPVFEDKVLEFFRSSLS